MKLQPCNIANYKNAIALLNSGQVVSLPTKTVYGLAARADKNAAVLDIFNIKNRSRKTPLSVCVFTPSQAQKICKVSALAQSLMDTFWPGPLTLIMPKKPPVNISPYAISKTQSIGLRCPDIPWRQGFLRLGFSAPLVLTSANISGTPAPITAQNVADNIGDKVPLILDNGPSATAIESTVITVENETATVLRMGAIAPEDFAAFPIRQDY